MVCLPSLNNYRSYIFTRICLILKKTETGLNTSLIILFWFDTLNVPLRDLCANSHVNSSNFRQYLYLIRTQGLSEQLGCYVNISFPKRKLYHSQWRIHVPDVRSGWKYNRGIMFGLHNFEFHYVSWTRLRTFHQDHGR